VTITAGRRDLETPALGAPPRLLFRLTAQRRKLVVHAAEVRKYQPHSVIVTASDTATHLFLLTKGKVKYYRVAARNERSDVGGRAQGQFWWRFGGGFEGLRVLGSPTRSRISGRFPSSPLQSSTGLASHARGQRFESSSAHHSNRFILVGRFTAEHRPHARVPIAQIQPCDFSSNACTSA
jgi:hypothetical protein